ncbi:MAG TPA: EAL domain-containing protein [Armatimonadota bacterium]|nr:EAL domain-containing protein [Armatimonadota bacterium]
MINVSPSSRGSFRQPGYQKEILRYAVGGFGHLALHSAFQPILSIKDNGAIIGYEGLLRATDPDGAPLSPFQAFATISDPDDYAQVDRLCRTVHVENFLRQQGEGLLFLNVHPNSLVQQHGEAGRIFQQIISQFGIASDSIVIEVLEGSIDDETLLIDAIQNYQSRGFRVAVDDFGSGQSNFRRLWRISPEIVKLDRSMLLEAAENPKVRRQLSKLVDLIHDWGSEIVIEGVETLTHVDIAIGAGADYVQGYYFARPTASLTDAATQAHRYATTVTWQLDWSI